MSFEFDAVARRAAGQWTVTVPQLQATGRASKLAVAEQEVRTAVAARLGVELVHVVLRLRLGAQGRR